MQLPFFNIYCMEKVTQSAGLLMYRNGENGIEIFLCRPFSLEEPQKERLWGIPKGRIDKDEEPLDAAKREFFEETGLLPPDVPVYYLGKILYPSGKKQVSVWTFKFNPPTKFIPKSNFTKVKDNNGNYVTIPEIGEWKWFTLNEASKKIMISQIEILSRFMRFMRKNTNNYGKKSYKETGSEYKL